MASPQQRSHNPMSSLRQHVSTCGLHTLRADTSDDATFIFLHQERWLRRMMGAIDTQPQLGSPAVQRARKSNSELDPDAAQHPSVVQELPVWDAIPRFGAVGVEAEEEGDTRV